MNTEIQTHFETVSESEALVLREDNEGLVTLTPVSYTHLTLPTILLV